MDAENFMKSVSLMQYRELKDLTKLKNNPRTISIEDMERLQASIQKFGVLQARPLILSNRTGELVIIGGNMRYEACKKLGIHQVPTHLIEGLSEEDEREIIIRDNVSNGAWDMDALANEWDINLLGQWGVEVEPLITKDEEKELIEDNLPKIPEVIYVQEGDIFRLGNHTLMCGNSMNEEHIQKLLTDRDIKTKIHCISDPPYGISYTPDKHGMIMNDDVIMDYTKLAEKYSDGYFCMWTGYQVVDDWMKLVKATFGKINNIIIWHKGGGGMGDCARTLAQDYEILLVNHRGSELQGYRGSATWMWNQEEKTEFIKRSSKELLKQVLTELSNGNCIWKVGKDDTMTYLHPTQKPVEINQRVLENFTAQGEQVLDLFGGSGSNLIACEKTMRKCFMMELDPKYVQLIIKRYAEYTEMENTIYCTNRDIDMSLLTNY